MLGCIAMLGSRSRDGVDAPWSFTLWWWWAPDQPLEKSPSGLHQQISLGKQIYISSGYSSSNCGISDRTSWRPPPKPPLESQESVFNMLQFAGALVAPSSPHIFTGTHVRGTLFTVHGTYASRYVALHSAWFTRDHQPLLMCHAFRNSCVIIRCFYQESNVVLFLMMSAVSLNVVDFLNFVTWRNLNTLIFITEQHYNIH